MSPDDGCCRVGRKRGLSMDPAPQPPIDPPTLARLVGDRRPATWEDCKVLVVDCRRYLDYSTSHIRSAVNICCSKLVRRRLQENKISGLDVLMQQLSACGFEGCPSASKLNVVLYDHQPFDLANSAPERGSCGLAAKRKSSWACGQKPEPDSAPFVHFLLQKLTASAQLASVTFLKGGFMEFQSQYPELCEGAAPGFGVAATPGRGATARLSLSSLSQPCLPLSNQGPTKILPFLYLGSQQDALDFQVLKRHGIHNVLNLSISCPRPDFLGEENFLRIPVNDSYSEKLLPHFEEAFRFLDKVSQSNGSVLVHCLAGISRSPTLAIAYVMRHLHLSQEEAYRYIKEKRPSISPNFNFLGQLFEYEKVLKEALSSEIAAKIAGSRRRVVVPSSGKGAATAQADPKSSPMLRTLSLDGSVLKRSFSCPNALTKLEQSAAAGASEESSPEPSPPPTSDSAVQAPSPVRLTATETVAAPPPPAALPIGPPLSRPSGLCGLQSRRPMRIPSAVQEDLPSPSTELSRLSFGSVAALPPPPTTSSSPDEEPFVLARMEVEEPFEDVPIAEASPPTVGEAPPTPETPSGEPFCASNPIFAAMSSCRSSLDESPPTLDARPLERQSSGMGAPVTAQPPNGLENRLFAGAARPPPSKRSGPFAFFGAAKKPTLERQRRSVADRFGNLLKKVSWSSAVPIFAPPPPAGLGKGFLSGYFVHGAAHSATPTPLTRSQTSSGIPHTLGSQDSRSESGLSGYSGAEDGGGPSSLTVESPESGFVEGGSYRGDPERESLGSSSSLEIQVA